MYVITNSNPNFLQHHHYQKCELYYHFNLDYLRTMAIVLYYVVSAFQSISHMVRTFLLKTEKYYCNNIRNGESMKWVNGHLRDYKDHDESTKPTGKKI